MRKIILAASVAIALVAAGCKKNCNSFVTSPCILSTIEANKNKAAWSYSRVEEYEFQGALVYILVPSEITADMQTDILRSDCTSLCRLGGIAGIQTCNGEKFYDNAVFKRTVWKR